MKDLIKILDKKIHSIVSYSFIKEGQSSIELLRFQYEKDLKITFLENFKNKYLTLNPFQLNPLNFFKAMYFKSQKKLANMPITKTSTNYSILYVETLRFELLEDLIVELRTIYS